MIRFELKDDYKYFVKKYKGKIIIDNYNALTEALNNKRNLNEMYLLPWENNLTMPLFFDINYIKKNFKGYISSNRALCRRYMTILEKENKEVHYIQYAFLNGEYYSIEDKFVHLNDKIKGICGLNKIYYTGNEGEIIYLREQLMNNLQLDIKHTYGPKPWGDPNKNVIYQNFSTDPYSTTSLEIRNKYMFTLALETVYNAMWSYDWVTERLWNCFKAKTIPLYLGAYNIEEIVPPNLFIDLRKYIKKHVPVIEFDYEALSDYLVKLMSNKVLYANRVDAAYEWQKKNTFGNVSDIEKQLDRIVGF